MDEKTNDETANGLATIESVQYDQSVEFEDESEKFWNDAMLMESLATESVRLDQEAAQFTNDYFELNPKPRPLFTFKVR